MKHNNGRTLCRNPLPQPLKTCYFQTFQCDTRRKPRNLQIHSPELLSVCGLRIGNRGRCRIIGIGDFFPGARVGQHGSEQLVIQGMA